MFFTAQCPPDDMTKREPNPPDFIRFLEEDSAGFQHLYEIAHALRKFLSNPIADYTADERTALDMEILASCNRNSFDDDEYWQNESAVNDDYFKTRLTATKQPRLRFLYATALWHTGQRSEELVEIALASLFELLANYAQRDEAFPGDHWGMQFHETFTAFVSMAYQYGRHPEVANSCVLFCIEAYPIRSGWWKSIGRKAATIALDRKLGPEHYRSIIRFAERATRDLSNPDEHRNAADSILPLAKRAAAKLGQQTKGWDRRIADNYATAAELRVDEKLVAADFIASAANHYRLSGDSDRFDAMMAKHAQLKREAPYKVVSGEYDATKLFQDWREAFEPIAESGKQAFFETLLHADWFFSTQSRVRDSADKLLEYSSFVLFPTARLDSVGNAIGVHSTDEKNLQYRLSYARHVSTSNCGLMLRQYLLAGVRAGTLNQRSLYGMLQSTWLARRLTTRGLPSEDGDLCWLESMMPSMGCILGYLEWQDGKRPRCPDLRSAIDSLVLKFEGIIRQLLRLGGRSTTKSKEGPGGSPVQEEMQLRELLKDQWLVDQLGSDDIAHFEFVLVERTGWNLRNVIAHSLVPASKYSSHWAVVLFHLVFRLARLDVESF